MKFGIITYQFTYSAEMEKVCISTTDIQPAGIHWYTRDEILELIASTDNGLKEIYQAALRYFPAASGSDS